MGINAGELDREVILQTATKTQDDDTGEEVIGWVDTETLWAQWLPAGTREAWQAQQRLGSYIDGVFRIYYRLPEPSADSNRLKMGDRVFDIKPCIEIERGEGWEIAAVARGAVP